MTLCHLQESGMGLKIIRLNEVHQTHKLSRFPSQVKDGVKKGHETNRGSIKDEERKGGRE